MHVRSNDTRLLGTHREHITSRAARMAFDTITTKAAMLGEFCCEPRLKGVVRDFRFYDSVSGEQPFAFIVNKNSLLFYIRKPGLRRLPLGRAGLNQVFAEVSENKHGELKVRISNERDAGRLMAYLFQTSDAKNDRFTSTAPGSVACDSENHL